MTVLVILITMIFKLLLTFGSAFLIAEAIREFKKQQYFRFGLDAMFTVLCVLELIKFAFIS